MPRKTAPSSLERVETWLWRTLIISLIIMVLHATIIADGRVSQLGYGYWMQDHAFEPGELQVPDRNVSLPVLADVSQGEDEGGESIRLLLVESSASSRPIAWVNGEPRGSFQRSIITLPVDAGDVITLSGVKPGEKIVVKLIGRSRGLAGPPLGSTWEVGEDGVILPIP